MEIDLELSPKEEKALNDRAAKNGQTVQEFVVSFLQEHFRELARTESMLDGRYDDLKSGRVKSIPGDDVVAYFQEKSGAMRRLKSAA